MSITDQALLTVETGRDSIASILQICCCIRHGVQYVGVLSSSITSLK